MQKANQCQNKPARSSISTRSCFIAYGYQWEDQESCNQKLNDDSVEFLDDLHEKHRAATSHPNYPMTYYDGKHEKSQVFRYTDLMYAHIRYVVKYFPEALEQINALPSRARDRYGMRVAGWITEGAHIYFDDIPEVIADI